jgi:excisionase family DNA binding protein
MTNSTPRAPHFFSVAKVAAILEVSAKTVRRWIARGDLRVHQLGRQLRIAEEDLMGNCSPPDVGPTRGGQNRA